MPSLPLSLVKETNHEGKGNDQIFSRLLGSVFELTRIPRDLKGHCLPLRIQDQCQCCLSSTHFTGFREPQGHPATISADQGCIMSVDGQQLAPQ